MATIVVKLRKGSEVEARDGILMSPRFATGSHAKFLALAEDLREGIGAPVRSLFGIAPTVATFDEQPGDVSSLARYLAVTVPDIRAESIRARLVDSDAVEFAYIEPAYSLPIAQRIQTVSGKGPWTPSNYESRQVYLGPAPGGVGARNAWPNLSGDPEHQVSVADIEGGWTLDHEDFGVDRVALHHGVMDNADYYVQHGTASVGQMAAVANGIGVTGVGYGIRTVCCCSIFGPGNSVPQAIRAAGTNLRPGDIMLIELQVPGPTSDNGEIPDVPVEWLPANFEAVREATRRGIVAVAAAGNGATSLDHARYTGAFDRASRDSGALLVGAGAPPCESEGPDRTRLPFSNWGSRVDLQGQGAQVTTAGYNDLSETTDRRRWYTGQFNGTSSAAPIVAGAAALVQTAAKARGQRLSSSAMRELLARTGSPQMDAPGRPATEHIGPRPNVVAAIARL